MLNAGVGSAGVVGDCAGRLAAPAARSATSVSGAFDAVAADGTMQQEELQLTATVLQFPWAQPFDVWAAVRRAWSSVRGPGRRGDCGAYGGHAGGGSLLGRAAGA